MISGNFFMGANNKVNCSKDLMKEKSNLGGSPAPKGVCKLQVHNYWRPAILMPVIEVTRRKYVRHHSYSSSTEKERG